MSFILTLMIIFTLNLTFYLQSYGQEFLNPGFEESFSSEACDDCDEGLGCIVGWWNYLPHNSNFTGYRFVYDYDCTGNRSGVCQGDYGLKFYRNTLDIHQPIQISGIMLDSHSGETSQFFRHQLQRECPACVICQVQE